MADVQLNTRSVAVKTAYEANANTNAFTDAEKDKLADIPSTFDKSTVGLGNVDNTSDADKPVSDDTQAALDLKVSSIITGITGADAITNMVSLTQAEYDDIGSPSATTFYVITDA